MKLLLATPPLVQLNTPYPATCYLKGYLDTRGYHVSQVDPAIDIVLSLFSKRGLPKIHGAIESRIKREKKKTLHPAVQFFLDNYDQYLVTVEPALRLLQGHDPSLAHRIVGRGFLPEGERFRALEEMERLGEGMEWAFGAMGIRDRARYLTTLYFFDLVDAFQQGVDERFSVSRYAEKIAASQPDFDPILEALEHETLFDEELRMLCEKYMAEHQPTVVALSIPFPGCVYSAFRMAKEFKRLGVQALCLGGGYVNTELRELEDPRVFDFFDFITFDDGERPLECVLEFLQGKRPEAELFRTLIRQDQKCALVSTKKEHDVSHANAIAPSYEGLPLQNYLAILEVLNPMSRIWSDARWNKITLAHGCYWKKCNFCDITLDYIGRYEAVAADLIIDRMQVMMSQTGESGFHFVDEAAPPAVLKSLSKRLLERGIVCSWWGNVRFDKTFTPELCELMSRAGCIGVSGGLEVASDRLLKLMSKGVSVEQVAQVTRNLTEAGIMVHAYLMYGFPTQTEQETVDSLEMVRQLFAAGCIQSAFWHRFAATAHSPIGKSPEKFGIQIHEKLPKALRFGRNDLDFTDPTGCDHKRLESGLNKALYNFMHGTGFDTPVHQWFMHKAPKTQVKPYFVERALDYANLQ